MITTDPTLAGGTPQMVAVAVVALAEITDFVHAQGDLVLHFLVQIAVKVLDRYGFAHGILRE